MALIIIFLFTFAALCAFLEEYLGAYKKFLYFFFAVALILLAGFREIGVDPDSDNYEYTYQHYESDTEQERVETSYIFLSMLLNNFTSDAHAIFLLYAIFGVGLKFLAFRKLSPLWFLPLVVYMGYYFELHEMTQMRTGIVSGLFLLSIPLIADGKRGKALLLLLIGALFHISALALIPVVFLSNKKMTMRWKLIWACVIPFGYMMYFSGTSVLLNADLPYVGNKLALYQTAAEKVYQVVTVNVFSPIHLLSVMLFYYMLFFYDTIVEENKYVTIMLKVFSLGLACFTIFSFVPVLAQRMCYLLNIVNIILYTNIFYTFRPKWSSALLICALSLLLLNYGMGYIDFVLFWKA